MATFNKFDDYFEQVAESNKQVQDDHGKFIEGIIELSAIQKLKHQKQKQLADAEAEIVMLKSRNRSIKVTMVKTVIQRDEVFARRSSLESNIESLQNQCENLNREIDDLLKGDEVEHVRDRFSGAEQLRLINKIQDNRAKLIKMGFPLNYFA